MADHRIVGLHQAWVEPEVDEVELWRRSGGQWLTAPGVSVPARLVRALAGVASYLDQRGAGLDDIVGAGGTGVVGERAALMHLPTSRRISAGGASRLLRCVDGWIAVSLARPEDVDAVPAWLGVDLVDDPWSTVEHAVVDRTAGELVAQADLLGLACSQVGETARTDAVLVEQVGDSLPRPLDGLVVANLASLWAGPLAADVLARLGARVLTVESTERPDGGRAARTFFEALHGRTESVGLPLRTERGRRQLRELLEQVDVVIEGSRPRALRQMGIMARSLVVGGPRIWLSITGHGRAGNRVGFGDDTAAAGGLVGWIGGEPTFLADAIADPVTGLVAGATVAQLAEHGGRWLVDVALARVSSTLATLSTDPQFTAAPDALRPQVRRDPGRQLPLGRDTTAVLHEFGIAP